jgi:hypothetical protein
LRGTDPVIAAVMMQGSGDAVGIRICIPDRAAAWPWPRSSRMAAAVQVPVLNPPGRLASAPAPGALLTRRELAWWGACWALVSTIIVLRGFMSRDPDSALYAGIAGRLVALPVSQWIAPEWWGFWNSEGLFREHPAGIFWLPALLGRLGVPAEQAAFVVGITLGLVALWGAGLLVSRLSSPRDGRAALVLLQLMPAAFLFRVRANHEYPMFCCLVVSLLALDGVRTSWWRAAWLAAAVTAAVLVKGVFVAPVLAGMGAWILLNPSRGPGGLTRPVLASVLALAATAVVAVAYDAAYAHATGAPFWSAYWRRQVGPAAAAASTLDLLAIAGRLVFYVRVMAVWSLPWSLAALAAAWRLRGRLQAVWRGGGPGPPVRQSPEVRGLLWAASFAALVVLMLSPANRVAERYVFSPTLAIGAAAAVVTYRQWPPVATALARLEARVPALPATVWLVLMLGRLLLGPLLPRI